MNEIHDVVVIGAGCAGLNIAQRLGDLGLNTCLIDSKKDLLNLSFHTLGSFINLEEVGLSENVVASKIRACSFYSKNYHFTKAINGHILDKVKLHEELLKKAIDNHVKIKNSTKIISTKFSINGFLDSVLDERGNVFQASIFVDTSGISGFLSRKVGLQDEKIKIAGGLEYNVKYLGPEHQAHLFIGSNFKGGYGWIFLVSGGRAIIGYGTFNQESIAKLKHKLDGAISNKPIRNLVRLDDDKTYGGTIPVTPIKRKLVYKNIVCAGDSISQASPLVGEGYRFILKSGLIAAPYIKKAIEFKNTDFLKGYEQEWGKNFYNSFSTAKKLQTALGLITKSDLLSNIAARFIGKWSDKKFERILASNF